MSCVANRWALSENVYQNFHSGGINRPELNTTMNAMAVYFRTKLFIEVRYESMLQINEVF